MVMAAASPRTNQGRTFPPEVLTPIEVARLMDACPGTPVGARTRALIALLYRSGLRISEALALRPKDLDADAGTVRVLRGKGGKSRTVGMDPRGFDELRFWLSVRRTHGVPDDAPLFCSLRGDAITSAGVRYRLPRLARDAGIAKRVHAHGLRHTHAAELRAEGVEIGVISKQLGHNSIATTALYVDHLMPGDVIDTVRRRQWAA